MKKQIITIALGILMLASAMAMYAGESISFETNFTNPVYTVVGNSSNLEGLNVSFESGLITISPVINYKPDNFTLIFFDNITNEVIKETIVYSGGRTKYVDKIEIQNQTIYVPEYIEKEVEVEKIVDNTTILKTGYELWHLGLAAILCLVFGWYISKNWRKEDEKL